MMVTNDGNNILQAAFHRGIKRSRTRTSPRKARKARANGSAVYPHRADEWELCLYVSVSLTKNKNMKPFNKNIRDLPKLDSTSCAARSAAAPAERQKCLRPEEARKAESEKNLYAATI